MLGKRKARKAKAKAKGKGIVLFPAEDNIIISNNAVPIHILEEELIDDPESREVYKGALLHNLREHITSDSYNEVEELLNDSSQNLKKEPDLETVLDNDDLDIEIDEIISTLSPIKTTDSTKDVPDTAEGMACLHDKSNNFVPDMSDLISEKNLETRGNVESTLKLIYNNTGLDTKRSGVRGGLTGGIGDAQQMIDMWGKDITSYAKGAAAKCYLCNLKIVPLNSCPEMEHKIPVANAYLFMRHYRDLKAYIGDIDANRKQITMYTLWNKYVNTTENYNALMQLYIAINEGYYNATKVDNQYKAIFNDFWMTTKYRHFWILDQGELTLNEKALLENVDMKVYNYTQNPGKQKINDLLTRIPNNDIQEDNEDRLRNLYNLILDREYKKNIQHQIELYNFFYSLIKFWLLEFAYAHHTCNQAKSDSILSIKNANTQFKTNAWNRTVSKKDQKTVTELVNSYGTTVNLNKKLEDRKKSVDLMLNDLCITREAHMRAYGNFTKGIAKTYQLNTNNVSKVSTFSKSVFRLVNDRQRDCAEQGKNKQRYEQEKQQNKEYIVSLYKKLKQIESVILEIESGNQQIRLSKRIELKKLEKNNQDREVVLTTLKERLKVYYEVYNEEVREVNLEETDIGDGEKISADTGEAEEVIREESQVYFDILEQEVDGYKKEYMEDPLIGVMCENSFESEETHESDREEYVYNAPVSSSDAIDGFSSPHQKRIKRTNTFAESDSYGSQSKQANTSAKERYTNRRSVQGEALFQDITQYQPNNTNPAPVSSSDAIYRFSSPQQTRIKRPNIDTENLEDNLNEIKKFRPDTTVNKRVTKRKGKTKKKK